MIDQEAKELMRRSEEIEWEKEQKKAEREARKLEKERKSRQEFLEKLVAPIMLIVTVLIGLWLYFF